MINYAADDFEENMPVVNWAYPDEYMKKEFAYEKI